MLGISNPERCSFLLFAYNDVFILSVSDERTSVENKSQGTGADDFSGKGSLKLGNTTHHAEEAVKIVETFVCAEIKRT